MDKFYQVDPKAEKTFIGRFDQARRELSAVLRRDVYAAEIAEEANLTASTISNHRARETKPTTNNIKALAEVFQRAGLTRFTAKYLEDGTPAVPRTVVRSDQVDAVQITTGKKRARRAG